MSKEKIRFALQAGFFHLVISGLIALLVAGVVFYIWFPHPYRELAGGRDLFILIVSVDVVCGPLLTLILASPYKAKSELVIDLGIVALLQVCALAIGLYSISMARPVALVFEVDRFRAVTAAEINPADQERAAPPFHTLSWIGPKLLGIRPALNGDEQLESIELGLQGIEPSMRPQWWESYERSAFKALSKAKPIQVLRRKHPHQAAFIDNALRSANLSEANSLWLPLVSRKSSEWVVVLNAKSGQPKAYLPLDGF